MECREAEKLLTEYIDGTLPPGKKALLEEHVKSCGACAEELAFLQRYRAKLSALEKVSAPADFLQQVRSRLERRSSFKKIWRVLSEPMQLRIPPEAVVAAATVLIVAFILHTWQPGKGFQRTLSLPRPPSVDMKGRPEPVRIALGKKFAGIKEEEKILSRDSKEEKPIQLVLLADRRLPPAPRRRDEAGERGVMVAGAPPAVSQTMELEETGRSRMFLAEDRVGTDDKSSGAPLPVSEIISRIKKLIELAEGRIIILDYKKETNLPQYITAEIPAVNYNSFLEKLGQLGELQEPLPPGTLPSSPPITLRINLISSN